MAKHSRASALTTDTQTLRDTVEFIDRLSQGGFSEISAIAKLALAQLEHPDGYRHPETIAQALNAILGKAEDVENCINSQAEGVGCNYIDDAQARRFAARGAARQNETTAASHVVNALSSSTKGAQS